MNKYFDKYGNFTGEFPADCVADCSAIGDCTGSVEYWQKELGFTVQRNMAIDYLIEYGAWDDSELSEMSDTELAQRVLWLACGDVRENGEYLGMIH